MRFAVFVLMRFFCVGTLGSLLGLVGMMFAYGFINGFGANVSAEMERVWVVGTGVVWVFYIGMLVTFFRTAR